jgi:putative flippase GtrA
VRTQILRFTVAGIAGFLVDAGILWVTLHLGLGFFAGRVVSFFAAVWTTWQINRRFTFAGHNSGSIWREWWRYLSAMSLGGCINYAAYSAVVLILPGTSFLPFLAVAVGSLSGLAMNFMSARWWVFRHQKRL